MKCKFIIFILIGLIDTSTTLVNAANYKLDGPNFKKGDSFRLLNFHTAKDILDLWKKSGCDPSLQLPALILWPIFLNKDESIAQDLIDTGFIFPRDVLDEQDRHFQNQRKSDIHGHSIPVGDQILDLKSLQGKTKRINEKVIQQNAVDAAQKAVDAVKNAVDDNKAKVAAWIAGAEEREAKRLEEVKRQEELLRIEELKKQAEALEKQRAEADLALRRGILERVALAKKKIQEERAQKLNSSLTSVQPTTTVPVAHNTPAYQHMTVEELNKQLEGLDFDDCDEEPSYLENTKEKEPRETNSSRDEKVKKRAEAYSS